MTQPPPTFEPASSGPPLAAWSRKKWVGPFSCVVRSVPTLAKLVGVTEHATPATNIDVLVDFSQSSWGIGLTFELFLSIYVISATGQKFYVSEWIVQLPAYSAGPSPAPTAVIPSAFPVPTPADNGTVAFFGQHSLLIQRGGVAGMVWGIEAAAIVQTSVLPGSYQLSNVFIGSIVHGREI